MTVTEEELQWIVARAVKVALDEIKGAGDAETPPTPPTIAPAVEVKPFGEEELDDAMKFMAAHRKKK